MYISTSQNVEIFLLNIQLGGDRKVKILICQLYMFILACYNRY